MFSLRGMPFVDLAYLRKSDSVSYTHLADETTGIGIIKRAIEEPLREIVANAGKEGAVAVSYTHL